MFTNGNTRGYNCIGAYPALIFYPDGRYGYRLRMYRQVYVFIFMVQTTHNDILRQYHIVAYLHRPYQHIAHTNKCIVADEHIANAIVDGAKIFDGSTVT